MVDHVSFPESSIHQLTLGMEPPNTNKHLLNGREIILHGSEGWEKKIYLQRESKRERETEILALVTPRHHRL